MAYPGLCEFVDGKCRHCGYTAKFRADILRACALNPNRAIGAKTCVHLGVRVEPGVKVECCNGTKQIEMPASACAVFHRCLPTYRPTGDALEQWKARDPESTLYHLCDHCEKFERL